MNAEQRLDRLYEENRHEDILYFLSTEDSAEENALYTYADKIREKYAGNEIHLRAIIEFSNYCTRACVYCGINCFQDVHRYRIPVNEIIQLILEVDKKGFRTVVLQSGEDPFYKTEDYVYMIREVRKKTDIAITLAFGEKEEEEYRELFKAGADRYLLKHETSDIKLYEELNPGMSYKNRLQCLRNLKKIGFQTGSGIMIGLPGQTLKSIADDILLFKELDADMIGCGPYIPNPGAPEADTEADGENLAYRVLALNRIVTRNTHLPATTALSTVNEEHGRDLALQRGANVIMPNETPAEYRQYYEIYPNKKRIEVGDSDFIAELNKVALNLGRTISLTRGDSFK